MPFFRRAGCISRSNFAERMKDCPVLKDLYAYPSDLGSVLVDKGAVV